MNKKIILFALSFYFSVNIFAQVGINTTNPRTALDVNGDIGLRGELIIGANSSAGDAGQVLESQGSSLPPKWVNFKYETIKIGDYLLTNIDIKEDRSGIVLDNDYTTKVQYDDPLTSNWTVLEGLSTDFSTDKSNNQIVYTFQTVVQSPFNDKTASEAACNIKVMCGIFLGKKGDARSSYKLSTVREFDIQGSYYPLISLTLLASSLDLPKGDYQVLVAFQRRGGTAELTQKPLYVGQGVTSGTKHISNSFMNKSILRTDVFEPKD